MNSSNIEGVMLTYITTSNLYWDRFELDSIKEMPFTDAEIEKCTVKKGDLLVCEGGDIGRSAIWCYDNEIRIQNHIHRLRSYISLSNRFYYYVLYLWKMQDRIGGQGIGLQGLSSKALHKILVPLPTINEQQNIVDKLDYIFDCISDLDIQKDDFLSLVDLVKSKILDLAIQGKLVPQDPNDEPASLLLERIRVEKEKLIKEGKIKRDKKESVIFKGDDNSYYRLTSDNKSYEADVPFDIPDSWCWTTIPSVANVELGKTLDKSKNTGKYYPYLRSVNIQWGFIDLSDLNEMKFEEYEIDRYSVVKNDLLVCEGGDVGRCCVWENDESFLYQNALHRVRFYRELEPRFFLYVMMLYESLGILKNISTGVTIKHLTGIVLSAMSIPLPPLAEQKRIVKAVETIFAQLDEISNAIA